MTSVTRAARCFATDAAASYRAALSSAPQTTVTVLENGLRVVSEQTGHKTATIGFYIDSGSRSETMENNGVAHFLEHMLFKGTANRSQAQLETEVENMGALLNAYTSREQTVYYAKCFSKDIGHATEILTDLLLNPTLAPQAIEYERNVILREMQEVNNVPEEVALDYLHATAFQGSSLGYTILGPEENIKSITEKDIRSYIDTYYTAPNIVLAAAGGVDHDELVGIAQEHLGSLSDKNTAPVPDQAGFVGSEIKARDDSAPLASVSLAVEGCSWTSPDFFPMMVASGIIGSWDRSFGGANLSSRLAQRSASGGLAQKYMSFSTSYSDTGLWGCHGVCDREKVDDFIWALQDEWMLLSSSISDAEVERAKSQLKAAMLFQLDGTTAVCDEIGRQMLTYGRRMYAAEVDARIDAVDTDNVKAVARKYVYDTDPAVVGVGPIEGLADYVRLRAQMWEFTQ